jgi:hypothetical protein
MGLREGETMPVEITPQYMEAARRFHDNHPEHEAAVHRAFLGGLGLSEEAQAEIVKRNAPELAHHPQIGQIGAQPKSEHAKAVAALHESEQSGPSSENEQTDAYLRSRGRMGKREARAPLQRKGG